MAIKTVILCLIYFLSLCAGFAQTPSKAAAQDPMASLKPYLVGLMVADVDASVEWYRENLGFSLYDSLDVKQKGLKIRFMERNGFKIELVGAKDSIEAAKHIPNLKDRTKVQGFVKFSFTVEDIHGAVEQLKKNNVKFMMDITKSSRTQNTFALFYDNSGNLLQMIETNGEKEKVIEFLNKFQEGYTSRDLKNVRQWAESLMTEDISFIFTHAVSPDSREWQTGIEKAIQQFSNDWKRWGDLKTGIKGAEIKILNENTALVSMTATITRSVKNGFGRTNEKNIERCLKRLADLEKNDTKSTRLKLYTAIWDAGMVLKHTELGETFIWPLRVSMVLVKKKGKWKMNHVHFSHPMAGYPPVRIVDGKVVNY